MDVFNGSEPLPAAQKGGCWLIGNFDGLHKGHRAIINRLKAEFPDLGLITFEPHPRQFFFPEQPFIRLTPWPARTTLLAEAGIARLLVLNFDATLARMSARQFISDIIKGQCGAETVAVGQDFRFGAGRAGDVALLQAMLGPDRVRIMTPVVDETGVPYASSRVRAALAAGDVAGASHLLGWSWDANSAKQQI